MPVGRPIAIPSSSENAAICRVTPVPCQSSGATAPNNSTSACIFSSILPSFSGCVRPGRQFCAKKLVCVLGQVVQTSGQEAPVRPQPHPPERQRGWRPAGKAHFVRDDDHGHSFAGQLQHHLEHLAGQLRIQGGSRLVEQHQMGVHPQRTGDGHPLFLPAGELCRVVASPVDQPNPFQLEKGQFVGFLFVHFAHLGQPDHDVAQRRQMGEEVEILKNHADPLANPVRVDASCGDLFLFQPDPAGIRRVQQVDAAQQRTFARPAGPNQHCHFLWLDRQRKTLEDSGLPKRLVQFLHAQDGCGIHQLLRRDIPACGRRAVYICSR